MLQKKVLLGIFCWLICLTSVALPLKSGVSSPLDLHEFVGTWKADHTRTSLVRSVVVAKTQEGYSVQVSGLCGTSTCDWGTVFVSDSYPHGIKPWDEKYPVTFVAFKRFTKDSVGLAIFNAFNDKTHQADHMLEAMLEPA